MCGLLRIIVLCFAASLLGCVPALAAPSSDLSISVDDYSLDPVEVIVVPDSDFQQYSDIAPREAPSLVIGDTPPSSSPFYGSCWVTGTDSQLGTVTVYFPINYQSGFFGLTSDGYLFNISSSSVSGYLQGVYNNNVSASGFSLPRYRVSSGSSWEYVDLHLIPSDSNMVIASSHSPRYDFYSLYPYFLLLLIGGAFLCLWTRSRS